jgi:hypothetical protein
MVARRTMAQTPVMRAIGCSTNRRQAPSASIDAGGEFGASRRARWARPRSRSTTSRQRTHEFRQIGQRLDPVIRLESKFIHLRPHRLEHRERRHQIGVLA